jgi:LysM repeat protein
MEVYEPGQNRKRRARERRIARQQKQGEGLRQRTEATLMARLPVPDSARPWLQRSALVLSDWWWYILHKPQVTRVVVVIVLGLFSLFVGTHVLSGRIFPNVWALGVNIGDLSVDEAELALMDVWEKRMQIELIVEGERGLTLKPAELGLQLDARKTAEAARGVGLAGIPLGYGVLPVVNFDELTAQNALLDLMGRVEIPPYNAGYGWEDGQLVGVPGRDGRTLDVTLTLQGVKQDPAAVAVSRQLELLMVPVPPDVIDPAPYLDDARALAQQPLTLTGYDPFTNETLAWTTAPQDFTSWLEAGPNSLTLREAAFAPYIRSLDATLNPTGDVRFLDPKETMESVRQAIANKQNLAQLRIRYRPTQYEVVAGDTGNRIARKTGIPFYLIEEVNPGVNWNVLSIGQSISLPTRDKTLPEKPVPHKRIVVDLSLLRLVAFENGQQVFNWTISIGRDDAPTSPGVFQILDHNETALGSGAALCGPGGNCGQWEMNWFMGIYEVSPGLINGFHGGVLLPNGTFWSSVGGRDTYGCVMSDDGNAKALYDWADTGTVVEIISGEFAPQSDLARLAAGQQL